MPSAVMTDSLQPRLESVQCLHPGGLHRMAYWEWGDAANPDVIVCVHGLTRQGRDFDTLARALAPRWRVVCPDVAGRGRSDWLQQPMHYQLPQYGADMVTLLARLRARRLGWVGTSMGGLIGLGLAGLEHNPIQALVLNDIGPTLDPAGLMRIAGYVGAPARFASQQQGVDYLALVSASFGPHSPEQWLELSRPMLVAEGPAWRLHYDPRIALAAAGVSPEAARAGEQMLWALYDAVRAPTLVLRGAESDLLARETAQAMGQRGPRAALREFAGVGHAPTLVQADQVGAVRDFLAAALDRA
jgi:pimeloyl-ACP methyl ester carboxylesterase